MTDALTAAAELEGYWNDTLAHIDNGQRPPKMMDKTVKKVCALLRQSASVPSEEWPPKCPRPCNANPLDSIQSCLERGECGCGIAPEGYALRAAGIAGPVTVTDEMVERAAALSTTGRQSEAAYRAKVRRMLEAALSLPREPAPGHTDLMVSPESLDAWLKDNPPPSEPAQGENYRAFFMDVAAHCFDDGSDLDYETFCDLGVEHGLLLKTFYDPEKHSDSNHFGAEPGDTWYEILGSPRLRPPQPVSGERGVMIGVEILNFLHGIGPLDGIHFGDDERRHKKGRFWWRKYLPAAPQPGETK